MQFRISFWSFTFALLTLIPLTQKAQETTMLTAEEIEEYKEQSKQLVDFLEGTLNFLGDPEQVPAEKDIIINQSYIKIFESDETQVEDDLDPNREMALNKDVQAYLKDVDFFFKKVEFSFEIISVDQLVNDEGMIVFKISLNRRLTGVTVESDTIENNLPRYIEVNLNPVQKDLKIASVYTTKPDQKEELRYWWKKMPEGWKKFFADSLVIADTLPFWKIDDFTDSSLVVQRWAEDIRTDTMLAFNGDTIPIYHAPDSTGMMADTFLVYSTHYLRVADTLPVEGDSIYRNLFRFKAMTSIDLSWNMNITALDPLSELTDLKEIYFSNTLISDVSPLRNLNHLGIISCSGSKVNTLDPLRYATNLTELNCMATPIKDIEVLRNLKKLTRLNLGETHIASIQPLAGHDALKQLDLSQLSLESYGPLQRIPGLSDLNLAGSNCTSLDSLAGLTELQTLNISNTDVKDLSPLKNLESLSILQANYSKIENLSPLAGIPTLKYIYCDNTGIDATKAQQFMDENPNCLVIYNTEKLKQWWYDLPRVYKSIIKERIEVSDPIATEQLHTIINQTEVDLSGYENISNIEPLRMLHRIEKLNLENTSIGDVSPLEGLNNLSELNINNTRVKTLQPLEELQNLKSVSCNNTLVADLTFLKKSKNLVIVYCNNTRVEKENVLSFKEMLPNCLVIYQSDVLRDWWNGLDPTWQSIFDKQIKMGPNPSDEQLQQLVDLEKVEIYDDVSIRNLEPLSRFFLLQTLTVSNTRVSDISPLENLPKLRELNLPNNPIVDVPGIKAFKNLETLNLENTPVESLKSIGQVSWIKKLNIAGTKVKKLKGIEGMTSLEKLMINNTQIKNLKEIEFLYQLKELTCYRTAISSKTIEKFKHDYPTISVDYY